MSVFTFLTDSYDYISAKADQVQDLIIKGRLNRLQESTFEAVLLSAIEGSHQTDTHLDDIGRGHRWFRIRALDGSDEGRPAPFTAPRRIRISSLKMIINGHRQAYWEQTAQTVDKDPAPKQVWLCRYSKKNYRGPIILQRYIRMHDETFLTITDEEADKSSKFQGAELMGEKTPPTVPETGLSSLSDDLPFENYKGLAKGLSNMISFIGANLSSPGLYDYYRCGNTGPGGCADDVKNEFSANKPTTKTIKEIKDSQAKYQVPTADSLSIGVGGVGIFSISPTAMKELQSSLKLEDTIKFDKATQDGIGAYIILKRNATLGGYLLGSHTDVETAAHELAKQWSIFPSQYTGQMDGEYKERNKSYYALSGKLAKINAKQTVKYLESWQKSFQQFLGKPDTPGNQRTLLKKS